VRQAQELRFDLKLMGNRICMNSTSRFHQLFSNRRLSILNEHAQLS